MTSSIREDLDLCLVQMPFATLSRPSIALGLLKQYALEADLSAQAVYGNLEFAEMAGGHVYRLIDLFPQNGLLGEWLFSRAAFPDYRSPEEEDYVQRCTTVLTAENVTTTGIKAPAAHIFSILASCYPNLDARLLLEATRRRAGRFTAELAERIADARPKIVGCTTMFQQNCASLALLRQVKELDPSIITMLGGANCEGAMGAAAHRSFPWLDYVVSGEADLYFGPLCQSLLEKGVDLPVEDLPYGVWGPAHREQQRGARLEDSPQPSSDQRAVVEDLDRTSVPEFNDYFEALQNIGIGQFITPALTVESSRGCWWGAKKHCSFCGLNGMGMAFRSKSPERVIEEFTDLSDRWGVNRIQIVDNILDMRYFQNVVPHFAEQDESYEMFYEVKPNLRRDQLELLAKAGIRHLQPGIESMHSEVLKLLNKGGSPIRNLQILRWAVELGISVSWNFLLDAPLESDEWYEEMCTWLPKIFHLQPPGVAARIRFDRFSPYHMQSSEYGLDLEPDHRYRAVYPLTESELMDFVYYFEDRNALSDEDLEASRPGLRKLKELVASWRALYAEIRENEGPRLLTAREVEGRIQIRDLRPIATQEEIELEGLAAEIYRRCDAAPTLEGLTRALAEQASPAEVAEAVADLERLDIVLPLENRLVSLAIREPVVPQPTAEESPGGVIDDLEFFRAYHKNSFARHCVPSAREMSLNKLFSVS